MMVPGLPLWPGCGPAMRGAGADQPQQRKLARPRKAEVSGAARVAGLGQGGAARAGIYFRSQHISYSRHRVLK